jgi:hypothetical protein
MHETATQAEQPAGPGAPLPITGDLRIPVVALGMSLGTFLVLTFVLCVLFDLWFPAQAMNVVWAPLLPGFSWISWPSFFLGLIETFAYGWYVALIFGPLFNFFAARSGNAGRP